MNAYDLAWGTAAASTVTLSFWVRSSLTGTFSGSLYNGGGSTQSYVFNYTITSANTWENKTITVPGPTTGTWNTGNTEFLQVRFGLGTGATYVTATTGSWITGNYVQSSGSTSVVGTNGATFYMTGVQFETGNQATPFDFRDYGRELLLCQRYYYQTIPTGTNAMPTFYGASIAFTVGTMFYYPVTMRVAPTITVVGSWLVYGSASSTPQVDTITTQGYLLFLNGNNATINATGFNPNSSGYLRISSEL